MKEWMWLIALTGSLGAIGAALAAWRSAKETQKTKNGLSFLIPFPNYLEICTVEAKKVREKE